jgi:hypothetical protein
MHQFESEQRNLTTRIVLITHMVGHIRTVYGKVEELLPVDAPEPLGNCMTLTQHYVDANLMHDEATRRSVTGILHLVNKTPI